MLKIGDTVIVRKLDGRYSTPTYKGSLWGFLIPNPDMAEPYEGETGAIGVVVNRSYHPYGSNVIVYALRMNDGTFLLSNNHNGNLDLVPVGSIMHQGICYMPVDLSKLSGGNYSLGVGAVVMIDKPQLTYSRYQELADLLGLSDFDRYYSPERGSAGVVEGFAFHPKIGRELCIVLVDGRQIIIAKEALQPMPSAVKAINGQCYLPWEAEG